jgi:hypothetical protein
MTSGVLPIVGMSRRLDPSAFPFIFLVYILTRSEASNRIADSACMLRMLGSTTVDNQPHNNHDPPFPCTAENCVADVFHHQIEPSHDRAQL